VKKGHLVIQPFREDLVMPASYDLVLGSKILASPLGPDELGRVIELDDKNPEYRIQTGQMIGAMSRERMEIPLDMCSNSFGIRSEFTRKGLHCFGGPHLDPGWKGRLIVSLQNVGPEPIAIRVNEPFFTVTFERLEQKAKHGYEGSHQNQDDFPSDQYHHILSARTTSLAEIPALRIQVARLTAVIQELEERLPDPDEGYGLRPEIEQRLRQSLTVAGEQLLTPDQAWDKLEGRIP
jgi:dCTP deaminase